MAKETKSEKAPITIKKYANRRLYNTATSSYVTLDHLSQMVKDGTNFIVYDAKTGDDITRSVLTHIIVEEESKGENLLPIDFLRHLISFYGDSLQTLVPRYLDHSMNSFARNQEQMRHYLKDTLDGMNPFSQFEEMGKQNMAMFENAMKMFTPFYGDDGSGPQKPGDTQKQPPSTPAPSTPAPSTPAPSTATKPEGSEEQLIELRHKLDQMQKQLNSLTDGKPRD